MKVAQIQFAPKLADCEFNENKIKNFISNTPDVDLIVLPELANSGYDFGNFQNALKVAKQPANLRFVDFLVKEAAARNTHIISGYLELVNNTLYNSSVLVSSEGVVGNYRKMHLFMNEKNIFNDGDSGLPVFEIQGVKVGMLICFDYLFPEIWRIMALKGADIIVHPSSLLTQNAYIAVPGQALMNGYFIVTSNRIGTEGELTFCGKSFVVDPRGRVLSSMGQTEEGISITDFDPLESRNKMITKGNHILNDRCPENYSEILP